MIDANMRVPQGLEAAIAQLRRNPAVPVRAQLGDLELELRAVRSSAPGTALGDYLASLGPWEGETLAELTERLRAAREAGGAAEPSAL
jgi:hypothetical protein